MEIFTELKNKWENYLLGQHVSPKIAKRFCAIASRCSDGGVWHSHPQHHSKGDCQGLMTSARRQKAGGRGQKGYCLYSKLFHLFQLDSYFRHAALVNNKSSLVQHSKRLPSCYSCDRTSSIIFLSCQFFQWLLIPLDNCWIEPITDVADRLN